MYHKYSTMFIGPFIVCLVSYLIVAQAGAGEETTNTSRVIALPTDIAQELRDHNSRGQRGSCHESNIFVHGFRAFGKQDAKGRYKTIWFLGAPDYLCETQSFVSAIVDSNGNWTLGKTTVSDWRGSYMLTGVPVQFQHVENLGFFLTSERRVAGLDNIAYYSADGESWSSIKLPTPISKRSGDVWRSEPTISDLCVDGQGIVYVSYRESSIFEGSVWRTLLDSEFPQNIDWSGVSEIPDDVRCEKLWPQDFVPRSLRKKTKEGALFDISHNQAVLIPGLTK